MSGDVQAGLANTDNIARRFTQACIIRQRIKRNAKRSVRGEHLPDAVC